MNKLNTLIAFLSIILVTACGGGGGGSSETPSPGPTPTPAPTPAPNVYDPINASYTDKQWDSNATGWSARFNDNLFLEYAQFTGTSTYDLTTNVYQNNDESYDVTYDGIDSNNESFYFNFDINVANTNVTPLYLYGDADTPAFYLNYSEFADSAVYFFDIDRDYLNSLGIEYVSLAQLQVYRYADEQEFLFPTTYGDFTESEDVPTSGTLTKEGGTIAYYHEEDSTGNIQITASGETTLEFNFSQGTVSGSILYNDYVLYSEFMAGNGASGQITTIPDIELKLSSGQILGNAFGANLEYILDGNVVGQGYLEGYFYGPDANEIGASYFIFDADDTDDLFWLAGGALIGENI